MRERLMGGGIKDSLWELVLNMSFPSTVDLRKRLKEGELDRDGKTSGGKSRAKEEEFH